MVTFIRKNLTAERVGYHHVHMMRKANDPEDDFPSPVRIGLNAVAFVLEEIEAWQERRMAEREGQGEDGEKDENDVEGEEREEDKTKEEDEPP